MTIEEREEAKKAAHEAKEEQAKDAQQKEQEAKKANKPKKEQQAQEDIDKKQDKRSANEQMQNEVSQQEVKTKSADPTVIRMQALAQQVKAQEARELAEIKSKADEARTQIIKDKQKDESKSADDKIKGRLQEAQQAQTKTVTDALAEAMEKIASRKPVQA